MASVFRYEVVEREKALARASQIPAPRASQVPAPPPRASLPTPSLTRISLPPAKQSMAKLDVAATQELHADDILEMAESIAPTAPIEPPAPIASVPAPIAPSPEITAPATAYAAPPSRNVYVASPPPRSSYVAPPPQRAPLSVAPVEMDVPIEIDLPPMPRQSRADSTMQIDLRPRRVPKRKLGFIVAGAVVVSVGILVAGIARRVLASEDESAASFAALVAPVRPSAPAAQPATPSKPVAPKPSTDVASSVAPVGTVIGPAGRVYLDGSRLRGSSAIVPCGKHTVRIAPARKPHDVDVPCGGEIKVR